MSTDLVERLRERANDKFTRDYPLIAEAADEIERLRAAAVWHCKGCGTVTRGETCDCISMGTGTQKLVPYDYRAVHDHEIERLRTALEIISGQRQCLDNLMGNVDVACAALEQTR